MPAGRPSKYNKSIQDKADEYVNGEFMQQEEVPTQEGLSLYLGIGLSTLKAWKLDDEKPEFQATLERCNAKQAMLLSTGALRGDLNATIAKLMLHNHGYSDSVKQDNTSSDGSMTPKAFPTEIKITAKQDDSGDD